MFRYPAVLGVLLLFHSCYSAFDYKEYAIMEQGKQEVPFDVMVESIIGCVICCYGIAQYGKFEKIKMSDILREQSWDNVSYNPSLVSFNHRGIRDCHD
eukprot:TRINITY_DN10545_c0_g1_i3.p1 TRINITY_DN10545_c0_g1~~TRINITY_DN10545_c0_g1_i3.p1  ORF type:complete len:112 (+),score=13.56 TRINITY_DN10545_c0_g1_i3:43-336(+)